MQRLEAAAARGADIVVIDPRRTETAYRTGARWIPIRPGTDGALALGMIEVMIDEELYDEEFAERWCHGFDELANYVQHFRPEVVESITGVPADTVRDLARSLCRSTGACPVMYTGLEYSDSGIQAIRAVFTLFALAGHLDVPGGIGMAMQGTHFPINRACNQPNPDLDRAVAREVFPIYSNYRGESHASGLVKSVLEGDPYRIRGLIVHGASLLTSWPQTEVWRETLSKLDFLACIDRQMTADAAYADIVLPATTMFEIQSYMVYGPIFRLREKMIEPVGEARNDFMIMAELAKRLGYGQLYPQSEDELLDYVLEGSGHTVESVREAGGWVKLPSTMMEYKKWEKGGLRDDGQPGFETPTRKFEIWSTILEDYGYEPLPKYTEPSEGPLANPRAADRYPLVFNSGARPQTDFRSQHHGIKGLNRDHPEPTVEINTQDARDRGIGEGDLVEVSTARGSVRFRARVTEDIVQGAVECSMGGGTPVGPKAWRESNVNELTDLENYDEISGFPVYKALLCQVELIEAAKETGATDRAAAACATGSEGRFAIVKERPKPARRVYLDNNATTRVDEGVRRSMEPYLDESHGNPSSIYSVGRDAREAVEKARRQVARLLHARPRRIVFTSGGSESDNMAIKGVVFSRWDRARHVVTTQIEHPAVLGTCRFLEQIGCDVTYLPVDGDGFVSPDDLRAAIRDDTAIVSIMVANNEVGSIQAVADLCAIAHERDVLFHTDAVQAAGKIHIDVDSWNVDLLSISGHKFHAPKGVGALYVKKNVALEPVVHGGKQEGGLRGGTENVASIVGLGAAAELALSAVNNGSDMASLRDQLEDGVRKLVPEARLNGPRENRLPNTLNLTLPGLRGESLVVAMDQHGVSLSSGSACKTGSPDPTHVLIAMGSSDADAHCSLRFSLSHSTSQEDIAATLDAFATVLEELETTIRFIPCK
jgi:cysteine desulfurase NifS